jgi:hypothetical protein
MSRSGLRGGVARPDDDGFIDVICADEELLREEFESIIAAAWSDAPPSTGPPTTLSYQTVAPAAIDAERSSATQSEVD